MILIEKFNVFQLKTLFLELLEGEASRMPYQDWNKLIDEVENAILVKTKLLNDEHKNKYQITDNQLNINES